jgi:hypothetical protein
MRHRVTLRGALPKGNCHLRQLRFCRHCGAHRNRVASLCPLWRSIPVRAHQLPRGQQPYASKWQGNHLLHARGRWWTRADSNRGHAFTSQAVFRPCAGDNPASPQKQAQSKGAAGFPTAPAPPCKADQVWRAAARRDMPASWRRPNSSEGESGSPRTSPNPFE